MPNTRTCGTCKKMWRLRKGKRGGGTIDLKRGHCLVRTVYPKDRPGDFVYPPGARIEKTPNDMIVPFLVREDMIVPHCNDYEANNE